MTQQNPYQEWIGAIAALAGTVLAGAFLSRVVRAMFAPERPRPVLGRTAQETLPRLVESGKPSLAEMRRARRRWEEILESAEKGEDPAVFWWRLLDRHYPGDAVAQVCLVGFWIDFEEKFPRGYIGETMALARKWNVERPVAFDLLKLMPQRNE